MEFNQNLKARDIMSTNVKTVDQGQPIEEAAKVMRDENIGSVPVEEYNKIVGILTDRDIVLRGVAQEKDQDYCVCGDIMSREVVACEPDMELEQVAQLMSMHQIRRIPVVENGHCVGMISLGDLAVDQHTNEEAGEALSDISHEDQWSE